MTMPGYHPLRIANVDDLRSYVGKHTSLRVRAQGDKGPTVYTGKVKRVNGSGTLVTIRDEDEGRSVDVPIEWIEAVG